MIKFWSEVTHIGITTRLLNTIKRRLIKTYQKPRSH